MAQVKNSKKCVAIVVGGAVGGFVNGGAAGFAIGGPIGAMIFGTIGGVGTAVAAWAAAPC